LHPHLSLLPVLRSQHDGTSSSPRPV
jgi:hypothetical protein